MLTATYSIVAIVTEHDKARSILLRLQQYVETAWKGLQSLDFAFLNTTFDKLMQFDKYWRERKVELYLIPVLREAGREAQPLIAELDALSESAAVLLRTAGEQLRMVFDSGSAKVNALCGAMDTYCQLLFTRFEKEENELLPLARRILSVEDWFSIAAQFLSEDAGGSARKRRTVRPLPARSAQPTVNAG